MISKKVEAKKPKLILTIIYYFLICVVSILLVITLFSGNKLGTNFKLFTVQSGSMKPTLNVGDLIIIKEMDDYYANDIVTFDGNLDNASQIIITHRITRSEIMGDKTVYVTKGDYNSVEDLTKIQEKDILGKYIFKIPLIGYVINFARTPLGFILMLVVPCILIIVTEITKIRKEINLRKQAIRVTSIISIISMLLWTSVNTNIYQLNKLYVQLNSFVTFALFTDQSQIKQNSVSTGILSIDNEHLQSINDYSDISPQLRQLSSVPNIINSGKREITIKNNGTLPFYYSLNINEMSPGCSEIDIQSYQNSNILFVDQRDNVGVEFAKKSLCKQSTDNSQNYSSGITDDINYREINCSINATVFAWQYLTPSDGERGDETITQKYETVKGFTDSIDLQFNIYIETADICTAEPMKLSIEPRSEENNNSEDTANSSGYSSGENAYTGPDSDSGQDDYSGCGSCRESDPCEDDHSDGNYSGDKSDSSDYDYSGSGIDSSDAYYLPRVLDLSYPDYLASGPDYSTSEDKREYDALSDQNGLDEKNYDASEDNNLCPIISKVPGFPNDWADDPPSDLGFEQANHSDENDTDEIASEEDINNEVLNQQLETDIEDNMLIEGENTDEFNTQIDSENDRSSQDNSGYSYEVSAVENYNNYEEENKENLGDASVNYNYTENSYSEENNNSFSISINPPIEDTILFNKEE